MALATGTQPGPIHEVEGNDANLAIRGQGNWPPYVSLRRERLSADNRGDQWTISVDIPLIIRDYYPARNIQLGEVHISSPQDHAENNIGGRTIIADILNVQQQFDMTVTLKVTDISELHWKIRLSVIPESSHWDDTLDPMLEA